MSARNQVRNLSEVVTLEAWHSAAGADRRADLCVNVAFGGGRIGGAADDEVRFKLTLRQAEVVVVIPQGEPARVDPGSVRRGGRRRTGTATETTRSGHEASAEFGASMDAAAAKGAIKAAAGTKASAAHERKVELTEAIGSIAIEHGQDENGSHRWTLTPSPGGVLNGRVWFDEEQRRLTVIDTRADRARGLPPTVRVEVRCRREDLHITEVVLNDEAAWRRLLQSPLHRNREIAAIAYLKNRLFTEGLLQGDEGDLTNPYARLTLAAVAAEEA